MAEVDHKTLLRWYEEHREYERWGTDLEHFISILRVMLMERQVYASSVKFHERVNALLDDYDYIANGHFRRGHGLFKCLSIALRVGFRATGTVPDDLQAQVDKLRKFWDEDKARQDKQQ